MIKRVAALFLVFLFSIESFAAIVSDNDGAAFITKAEFDSLKNDFQAQIDNYNTSIDAKIDGAIAAYLAGIKVATVTNRTDIIKDEIEFKSVTWPAYTLAVAGVNWGGGNLNAGHWTCSTCKIDEGLGKSWTDNIWWDGAGQAVRGGQLSCIIESSSVLFLKKGYLNSTILWNAADVRYDGEQMGRLVGFSMTNWDCRTAKCDYGTSTVCSCGTYWYKGSVQDYKNVLPINKYETRYYIDYDNEYVTKTASTRKTCSSSHFNRTRGVDLQSYIWETKTAAPSSLYFANTQIWQNRSHIYAGLPLYDDPSESDGTFTVKLNSNTAGVKLHLRDSEFGNTAVGAAEASNVVIKKVEGGTLNKETNEITLVKGENVIVFDSPKNKRYFIKPLSAVKLKIIEIKFTAEN